MIYECDNRQFADGSSLHLSGSSSTTSLDDTNRFRVAVSFEGGWKRTSRSCDPVERKCINEWTSGRPSFRASATVKKVSSLSWTVHLENEGQETRVRINDIASDGHAIKSAPQLCFGTESAFDTSEMTISHLRGRACLTVKTRKMRGD